MLRRCVRIVRGNGLRNLFRRDLPVAGRKRQHLVPRCLDCAGFVHVDVPAYGADHALIRFQARGDDREVRLRAADEEMHVALRAAKPRLNQRARLLTAVVQAVGVILFAVCAGNRR